MLPALFAVTLFASAGLLFVVQPMSGKQLLPLAGGSPAVWNTCLVFFQAVLLLGYLYADTVARLPPRRQTLVQLAVAGLGLAAAATLRPDPAWIPDDSDYPVGGLVLYLAALVGAPFLALSATAPLLQRWFAATGHPAGKDPYFLYAASNAGSLVGLLAYPFVVEPGLRLPDQQGYWTLGFAALVGLVAACAAAVWASVGRAESARPDSGDSLTSRDREGADGSGSPLPRGRGSSGLADSARPTSGRVLAWVALAALPSSLLLSVTTHLTTDVAPVPLLWVVPLALYLVSFVVVFGWWPPAARRVAGRAVPTLLLALTLALVMRATEPLTVVAAVHLAALFGVALLCHGELAASRPGEAHLTTFYLALSAGGVLGGLVNALVAPVLFASLGPVEYPLAVALAGLVRPDPAGGQTRLRVGVRDGVYLLLYAAGAAALVAVVPGLVPPPDPDDPGAVLIAHVARYGLAYGPGIVAAFVLVKNPARFAACLGVLLVAGAFDPGPYGQTLETYRNFFGTLRVTRSADGRFVQLVHGTTEHGKQDLSAAGRAVPLMYYYPSGPVGRLFARLPAERTRRVGLIGLGVGAMAAYAKPGERWTYYEIDPGVVRVARDSGHFSFLAECRGELDIVLGDARRQLARVPDGTFDLLVLDAFSSDAIPLHLLTREAFALYARKLAPDGVLLFHLSNRYLDLPPLVARLAAAHDPPFAGKVDHDFATPDQKAAGKWASIWTVLARRPADAGEVWRDIHWQPLKPTPGPVWTDDYSSLVGVWKRQGE